MEGKLAETEERDIRDFVAVVKQALSDRLKVVSLDVIDIGLREYTPDIIIPGVKQYIIAGWVRRDATGKIAQFYTRVGGIFGRTAVEDIEPMVADLCGKLIDDFYPPKGE